VEGVRFLAALAQPDVPAVIRNNARQALQAWDAKNYVDAVVALKTVMSFPDARAFQGPLQSALNEMLGKLKPAAEQGNQAAKEAIDYLKASL
jgi:hypothetical protein